MCVCVQEVAKRTTTYKTAEEQAEEEDDSGLEATEEDLFHQQVRIPAKESAQCRHFSDPAPNKNKIKLCTYFYKFLYRNIYYFTNILEENVCIRHSQKKS